MNKYRKVIKPREALVKDDDEIRVTAVGSVSAYISRAAKLFNETIVCNIHHEDPRVRPQEASHPSQDRR